NYYTSHCKYGQGYNRYTRYIAKWTSTTAMCRRNKSALPKWLLVMIVMLVLIFMICSSFIPAHPVIGPHSNYREIKTCQWPDNIHNWHHFLRMPDNIHCNYNSLKNPYPY